MYTGPTPLPRRKHYLMLAGVGLPLLAYSIFLSWALVVVEPGVVAPGTADRVCSLVAAIIPVPLVMVLGRRGVLAGGVIVWATLHLAGVLLAELHPGRHQGFSLDGFWLLFGWLGGLLYCGLLYLARVVLLTLARRFWKLAR